MSDRTKKLRYVMHYQTNIENGTTACGTYHAMCGANGKEDTTCKKCLKVIAQWEAIKLKREAKRKEGDGT